MSEEPVSDQRTIPSLRSARESFRWLIKTGGVRVSIQGLHIVRDPSSERMLLSVDDVLDRLNVLEVPDHTIAVAVVRTSSGKAHFEIRVDNVGTDFLSAIYPAISELREAVRSSM